MWNLSGLENQHCRSREPRTLLLPALTIAVICGSLLGGPSSAAQKDPSEYVLKGWKRFNSTFRSRSL